MKRQHLLPVVIAGGLGGAINAALCYVKWPVPAADGMTFPVWIIPAGGAHGALLALAAVVGFDLLARLPTLARLAMIPVAGWVAGWLSFIPLHLVILTMRVIDRDFFGSQPVSLSLHDVRVALWPFELKLESLWIPFLNLGGVAPVCWVLEWVQRSIRAARCIPGPVVWIAGGIAGSLWWWASFGPWWFAVLHGVIWGGLVSVTRIISTRQQAS